MRPRRSVEKVCLTEFYTHLFNNSIRDTFRNFSAATVLLRPLIVPIDPHYRGDICKSFDRTAQTVSNNSAAQLLLCAL